MRIGTAGWTIPRENASHTPGEGTHLQRYARVFNCAEINSSFYRSHRASTWQRWAESVPEGFQFSVKAPKQLTHLDGLAVPKERLQQFLAEVETLGSKLGPLLFQLPPKLAFDCKIADCVFSTLRKLYEGPVVWEPRHPSWFAPEVESVLAAFRISRAAADPPVVPHASTPGASRELVYYRLHGSPRKYYSCYSDHYLADLATDMKNTDAKDIWCIFDNTASGAAFGNALQLQKIV